MRILAARLDNLGDVVLSGPAVRALAADALGGVVYACSPRGRPAAELLPGVAAIIELDAPWIAADPPPVEPAVIDRFVAAVRDAAVDEAVVFTSYHQSPLPLALLLRLAGVHRIAAISEDYPGSLLDVRHHVADDVHEVTRARSLATAAGHRPPEGDDGALRVELPADAATAAAIRPAGRYVVVHPGASVPARTWSPDRFAALVAALAGRGHPVMVTGGPSETVLTAAVAGSNAGVRDVGGVLDVPALAGLLAGADAVVTGNTGPAHLAAAVGTPVVSLFPPTVPAARWRPWGVPHVLLGDQTIGCAGCRAHHCPRPGHSCLAGVTVADAVAAVEHVGAPRPPPAARAGATR